MILGEQSDFGSTPRAMKSIAGFSGVAGMAGDCPPRTAIRRRLGLRSRLQHYDDRVAVGYEVVSVGWRLHGTSSILHGRAGDRRRQSYAHPFGPPGRRPCRIRRRFRPVPFRKHPIHVVPTASNPRPGTAEVVAVAAAPICRRRLPSPIRSMVRACKRISWWFTRRTSFLTRPVLSSGRVGKLVLQIYSFTGPKCATQTRETGWQPGPYCRNLCRRGDLPHALRLRRKWDYDRGRVGLGNLPGQAGHRGDRILSAGEGPGATGGWIRKDTTCCGPRRAATERRWARTA